MPAQEIALPQNKTHQIKAEVKMKLNAAIEAIRPTDVLFMVPVGIATGVAFCYAFGQIAGWQWLALTGAYELAYLWWVAVRFPQQPRTGIMFALKVQQQAAFQTAWLMFYVLFFVGLITAMFEDDLRKNFAPFATAEVWFVLLVGMAKTTSAISIGLSWARIYTFGKNRLKLNDLADGSYYRKTVVLPAPKAAVSMALARYLERMTHETSTRYSRSFYDANASITSQDVNGDQTFALTWTLCPVRIRIGVVASGAASTELRVSCDLRAGHYRTDVFASPLEAQSLYTYLQTHLFQPLISEFALTTAVNKQNELRHQAIESQLRILQAQIEPHFLFNTLANVRHLYRSSVDAGEEMMDHLIVYLRSTLEDLRSDVSTVGKEMDLILHYLAIMKIRMGERLSYGFIIPDALSQHHFPPAMLISLVENSIKHGLHDRADGKLTISCERDGVHLRVTVADNGTGFSSVEGTGVGLSNIRQRLEAMYGNRAWLEVGARADGGFVSSVMVPYEGNA
jgi:signal transduction histidine kinase